MSDRPDKVLLLGGGALLGEALSRVLSGAGETVVAPRSRELDIRELPRLRDHIRQHSPYIVINSAVQF